MKNNGVVWLLGAGGAFCVSWLAVRMVVPAGESPLRARQSDRSATQSPMDLPGSGFTGRGEPLHGGELQTALADILALRSPGEIGEREYVETLFRFAERVSSADFPSVLAALHASGKKEHASMQAELLAYWTERDVNSAWRYLVSLPARDRDSVCRQTIMGSSPVLDALARIDPDRLLSWITGLPRAEAGPLRGRARGAIAEAYGRSDPAKGFRLLFEGPEGIAAGIGSGEWNLFTGWAEQDPQAAAEKLLSLPAGDSRSGALDLACDSWSESDRDGLLNWARQLADPDMAHEAAVAVAHCLTNKTPDEALKFAVERGITEDPRVQWTAGALWLIKDTEGALRWIQALPDGPVRTTMITNSLYSVAEGDPQRALQLYREEFNRSGGSAEMAAAVVPALIASGNMSSVATLLAGVSGEEQVRIISEAPTRLRDSLPSAKLLAAGLDLPAGPLRDRWMDSATSEVTHFGGLAEAQACLAQFPPGPDRDRAGAKAVEHAFQGTWDHAGADPDGAIRLAEALGLDRSALLQGVSSWIDGRDRTAAVQWVQQTRELSADEKQRLLQPIQTMVAAPSTRASGQPTTAPQHQIPRP